MGHHFDSRHGSLVLDAALIEAIREGQVAACLLANGQIAFAPAVQDTTDPANPATRSSPPSDPEA